MRGLLLTSSVVFMLSFASSFAGAGPRVIEVPQAAEVPPGFETYQADIFTTCPKMSIARTMRRLPIF